MRSNRFIGTLKIKGQRKNIKAKMSPVGNLIPKPRSRKILDYLESRNQVKYTRRINERSVFDHIMTL